MCVRFWAAQGGSDISEFLLVFLKMVLLWGSHPPGFPLALAFAKRENF